jgi:hypothetical protein
MGEDLNKLGLLKSQDWVCQKNDRACAGSGVGLCLLFGILEDYFFFSI